MERTQCVDPRGRKTRGKQGLPSPDKITCQLGGDVLTEEFNKSVERMQ